MQCSNFHTPDGPIIQLIAINVNPSVAYLSLATDLRGFALHLAHLDPTVSSVCAVTRCRDFTSFNGTMAEYLAQHVEGKVLDPVVDFHTGYGAKFISLVHDYRPEDTDNNGTGVLIAYNLKKVFTGPFVAPPEGQLPTNATNRKVPTKDVLVQIMAGFGFEVDDNDLDLGFFDYDMDSLELVRIRNKLATEMGMALPSTLLLDYPSVASLSEQLDMQRGLVGQTDEEEEEQQQHVDENMAPWQALTARDVLDYMLDCKKAYLTGHYRDKFLELARRCYPDTLQYLLEVEPILIEVQAPLFLEKGLVKELDHASIQEARSKMTAVVMRYWNQVPEVRKLSMELSNITKQGQTWQ